MKIVTKNGRVVEELEEVEKQAARTLVLLGFDLSSEPDVTVRTDYAVEDGKLTVLGYDIDPQR